MAEMMKVELYIVWNEDGEMTADTDLATAVERMSDEYGGDFRRSMKLTLHVPLPNPIEATITIPETAGEPVVDV